MSKQSDASKRARAIYSTIQGLKDAYPRLVVFAIGWDEHMDEPLVEFLDVDPTQDVEGA